MRPHASKDGRQRRPTAEKPRAQLQGEVDRFKGERDQLVDRLARLQAEFENARKREARERADFRDFASPARSSNFCPSWTIFSSLWDLPAQWNSCVPGSNSS
jgi:molecular chaperone GrpE (heat shock protein)